MKIFIPFLFLASFGYAKDVAFLWLPAKEADFSFLTSSMPAKARLTIACSTNKCAGLQKEISSGSLEQAAMPVGMSFVSLLYFPSSVEIDYIKNLNDNPYLFASLTNGIKKELEKIGPVYGFLTPYGDLNLSEISLYKALGYSWAAAGKHREKQSCVFDSQGLKLPSFEIYSSTQQVFDSTCPFFIIDDSAYSLDSSSQTLLSLFSNKELNFLTVNQALSLSSSTSLSDSELYFYPWIGYKDYLNVKELYAYLKTLSLLKTDISVFLNSNPKKEKELMEQYLEAESLIIDLRNGKDISQAEEKACAILTSIYQLMGKPAPDFAYKPFFEKKEDKNYEVSYRENAILFSALNPGLSISEFSVSKGEKGLLFNLKASTQSRIEDLAIYLDINSAVGAGNTSLLNSVKEKIYVKNAWDYALVFEKDKLTLYGYSFYSLKKLKTYPLKRTAGEWQAYIPNGELPQNFEKWKYIVLNSSKGIIIDGIYKDLDKGFIYPL